MPQAQTDPAHEIRALVEEPTHRGRFQAAISAAGAPLCLRCLGRLVSRKGMGIPNAHKGRPVAVALGLAPAADDRDCPWCEGLFRDIDRYADLIEKALRDYTCRTVLIGTRIHPDVAAVERRILDALGEDLAEHAEQMKTELNREVGKVVLPRVGATVDFDRADVVVNLDPFFDSVTVEPNSLFLFGRYRKYDRTIPQTRWPCNQCEGVGCFVCQGTGQQYAASVEALVAEVAVHAFAATDESFHGSGREDIDALMLGTGRPFVLELKRPMLREPRDAPKDRFPTPKDPEITLQELEARINAHALPRVDILGLRWADRDEPAAVKAAALDKAYRAHVEADAPVKLSDLALAIDTITCAVIRQRTPERVAHRRADKVRERAVRTVEVAAFGDHARVGFEAKGAPTVRETEAAARFTLDIVAESGTYIKELVHGDEGRTQPSFAAVLGTPMRVVALDVVGVGFDLRPGDGAEE